MPLFYFNNFSDCGVSTESMFTIVIFYKGLASLFLSPVSLSQIFIRVLKASCFRNVDINENINTKNDG